jgi:hypothetical protein
MKRLIIATIITLAGSVFAADLADRQSRIEWTVYNVAVRGKSLDDAEINAMGFCAWLWSKGGSYVVRCTSISRLEGFGDIPPYWEPYGGGDGERVAIVKKAVKRLLDGRFYSMEYVGGYRDGRHLNEGEKAVIESSSMVFYVRE